MATWNADAPDVTSGVTSSVKGRFISWTGIQATTPLGVTYFMAAFDNLGNRYFWENNDASFTGSPTPAGSYVVASLVIEGVITLT